MGVLSTSTLSPIRRLRLPAMGCWVLILAGKICDGQLKRELSNSTMEAGYLAITGRW